MLLKFSKRTGLTHVYRQLCLAFDPYVKVKECPKTFVSHANDTYTLQCHPEFRLLIRLGESRGRSPTVACTNKHFPEVYCQEFCLRCNNSRPLYCPVEQRSKLAFCSALRHEGINCMCTTPYNGRVLSSLRLVWSPDVRWHPFLASWLLVQCLV